MTSAHLTAGRIPSTLRGPILERQGAGGTGFDAFGRCDAQTLSQRLAERHRNADIESPAYKRQAELLSMRRSNLDADATIDALAGLVDDIRMLRLLDEGSSLGLVTGLFGVICLRVPPQEAAVAFAAIAA